MSRTRFEAALDKRAHVKASEAAGQVADSQAVRLALMARVEGGELTLAAAQIELKKLQAGAVKAGLVTRNQAFKRG